MRGTSLVAALILAGSVVTAAALTRQLSDNFAKKIVLVQKMANEKSSKDRPTTFTQDETNSYLKFGAGELMPEPRALAFSELSRVHEDLLPSGGE